MGIGFPLILLYEAAYRRAFRHSGNTRQPIPQVPVVEGTQLLQVVVPSLVYQCILECPTNARGISPKFWRDTFGKLSANLAHVFQHSRAAPIDVGAFIEYHVDVGDTI